LVEDDVTVVGGLWVSTPVRTVVDCARVCSAPWTLAVADAAARRWSVTFGDLDSWFARTPPVPGKRREDALRETGLEVVRFVMADLSRSERWLAGYRRAVSRGRRHPPMPLKLT
jgi:hypothetical protein